MAIELKGINQAQDAAHYAESSKPDYDDESKDFIKGA